jgi:hypothetical protein
MSQVLDRLRFPPALQSGSESEIPARQGQDGNRPRYDHQHKDPSGYQDNYRAEKKITSSLPRV